ncbi:MAG: preprotein translocase subunit SecE [Bifidobacteriaceae bacterium]|nr:preprotein translocase subunit SecE [Bifidobacteriaceae bacterium]
MADRKSTKAEKAAKPNFFMRIGLFIKQIFAEMRKVVTPTGKELLGWTTAVFVFVLFLMFFVTGMDFGIGKLVFWAFG